MNEQCVVLNAWRLCKSTLLLVAQYDLVSGVNV